MLLNMQQILTLSIVSRLMDVQLEKNVERNAYALEALNNRFIT
jgi:hypothetical protein